MKKALVVLVAVAMATAARAEDPNELFNMDPLKTNSVKVNVFTSGDIDKTCDKEARRRGFGPYGVRVEACTFWSGDYKVCDIYVGKKTSVATLGHEFRHCLHGPFHKW